MEWTGSLHSSDKSTSTYKVPTRQHLVEGDVGNSEMSLTRALTPPDSRALEGGGALQDQQSLTDSISLH